jgi:phosphate transport system ATP-binding protein
MSQMREEAMSVSSTIESAVRVETKRQPLPPRERLEQVFDIQDLTAIYGSKPALKNVSMEVYKNLVTAIIGPSGCGKSTYIRCFNRMNDLVPGFRQTGTIRYHGQDISGNDIDPVAVRRTIGMVFQRPNPFPKSIYDNVAWGLKVLGMKDNLDERVERALTQAALWDEAKDRLKASALSLSGGQQQRLCIARAIAVEPDVVLMDEPASALDPIATGKIEDLMHEIKSQYTIVIVTHNMQQATRVSDRTAFYSVLVDSENDTRTGTLVEYGPTQQIFEDPQDPRTQAYVTGRMG